MPLKLATTRDCGGGVQFTVEITGIYITQRVAADRFLYAYLDVVTIRKKEKRL